MATTSQLSTYVKSTTASNPDIDQLLSRVEKPIAEWKKTKDYRHRNLTIKKTAEHIGITVEDFRQYLKHVVRGNLKTFFSPMRVEDAKILMFVKGGPLSYDEFTKAGFSDTADFYYTFKSVEGVLPNTWALEDSVAKTAFEKDLSDDIKERVKRVGKALASWERNMGYRKQNLSVHKVAKLLGVEDDDLYYYCCLELHDTIDNWIELQRIHDALILLRSESKKKISSIGAMLGFGTDKAFRNSFEKLTGVTPEAWRGEKPPTPANEDKEKEAGPKLVGSFDVEPIIQWKRKRGFCKPNLTQTDVAKMLGFSDARFAQYLKEVEKSTFPDWIGLLRIEEAKRLLSSDPDISVQQVAVKVGLPGKGKFRSLFWKLTNMSPESWRISSEHDIEFSSSKA